MDRSVLLATAMATAIACSSSIAHAQQDSAIVITGARLIDGSGGAPIENAAIVIRRGTIVAVGRAASIPVPPGAERIDATGQTAIPGLIDAHVHLGATPVAGQGAFTPEMLRRFVENGVTTIRSMGDAWPWIAEMRARPAGAAGPRIFAAGPMFTAPGGHPAGTWLKQFPDAIGSFTRQVADADSAAAEVRRLVAGGVDLVKIVFDEGSARSPFGKVNRLDEQVMNAIVAQARASGVPSAVHWANPSQLPAILAAGPDELVHVSLSALSDSLVRQIAARGIVVSPTIAAFAQFLPPAVVKVVHENVRRLADAGVPLVAGTDAPLGPTFGDGLHAELAQFVAAGLSPLQAITAATGNAARLLRADELGNLAVGKRADIVLLNGNPLDGIAASRDIRAVLIDGRVVYRRPVK